MGKEDTDPHLVPNPIFLNSPPFGLLVDSTDQHPECISNQFCLFPLPLFRFKPPASLVQMVSTAYLSSPFSFLPPHNPFPLELLRSCHSPTLNASAASYSSLTMIQTSCEALHSRSAVSPFQIMPSSPDTRASSLSLQEGEPSANSEHCVCHSSWSHSRCSAHRGAWKLLNIC